jgi:hypothetical protein
VLERIEHAGVARIILNRPDKRNCLNAPLVTALFEVQVGRDLSLSQAIQLDQLVGARLRQMDPTADIEGYPDSQKGGPNLQYKRPDLKR